MAENKTAKTPTDDGQPVAFCNGMPAYEGSLSKAQRLTQDLETPLTINGVPLYPKKQWVGLTDEERHSIREWQEIQKELGPVWAPMMLYLYEAIEAKLREKNT